MLVINGKVRTTQQVVRLSICRGANEEGGGNLSWGWEQGAKGQLTWPEESEVVMREAEFWRRESGGLQYARGRKRAVKQGQREGTCRGLGKYGGTTRPPRLPTHSLTHSLLFSQSSSTHPCSSANLSISSVSPLASSKVTQADDFLAIFLFFLSQNV